MYMYMYAIFFIGSKQGIKVYTSENYCSIILNAQN